MNDIEDLLHLRREEPQKQQRHERANVSGIHAGRTVYVQSYGCGHNVKRLDCDRKRERNLIFFAFSFECLRRSKMGR